MKWASCLASVLVLLEAVLLAILIVVVALTEDVDTGDPWIPREDLPVLAAPFVVVALGWLWASRALWRRRIFGAGTAALPAVVNTLTVLGVLAFNLFVAGAALANVASGSPDSFDAFTGAYAAIVVVGCLASLWASWRTAQAS
jgi:hypothetical protein